MLGNAWACAGCSRALLREAYTSSSSCCIERLNYSDDEAVKRVRAARLARRLPQVRDELRTGAIHLTGLFLLAQHLSALGDEVGAGSSLQPSNRTPVEVERWRFDLDTALLARGEPAGPLHDGAVRRQGFN